ncbi:hypothetical protein Taro_012685 [Colocasia esculenta]|uniref:RRM domain-containing protein n=1 Tax=Colocasia esculenta TaxID=4460 RepID=A0A843U9R2_COLES|nr:hypothetical protein [Colocasia esculenta]
MEAAAEDQNAVGGAEEYEYEEVVEEVEEEVEEVEEEVEEEEGVGGGGSQENGVDKVDSAGQETKQPVSSSSSEGLEQPSPEKECPFAGWKEDGLVLPFGTTISLGLDTFTKHFKKYGAITDSVIMKEKATGRPRGFGFITYADPSVVDKVLEDDHVIDGRTVEVKRTVPRETMASKGGSRTKKIFVGGLPTSLTEDEFQEYFSAYGKVVEHPIMLDHKTGRSRGFGFVTFESEDSVEEVISQGKMHTLGGKQVEIKKAEPKKPGGDSGMDRHGYGSAGGNAYGGFGGGAYGYGGGYRSGGAYGGRMAGPAGGYGRGYGYGGGFGYGMGYGPGYGGPMYGATGYGAGYGYGGAAYGGGYGSSSGGSGGGGGGSARYGGRYHPYGR